MSVCLLVHWFTCPWPALGRWPRGPSPASHRMIPVASIPISEHRCSHGRREGGRIVEQTLARSALLLLPLGRSIALLSCELEWCKYEGDGI